MLVIDFIQIERIIDDLLKKEKKMKRMNEKLEEIRVEYEKEDWPVILQKQLREQKEMLLWEIKQIHKMIDALEEIIELYRIYENKCLDYLEEVKIIRPNVQICEVEIPEQILFLLR